MTREEEVIINMLALIHEENKLILTSEIRNTVSPLKFQEVHDDIIGGLDKAYKKIFEDK